jgi:hypothetical protein
MEYVLPLGLLVVIGGAMLLFFIKQGRGKAK